jgi:hypothetical protein
VHCRRPWIGFVTAAGIASFDPDHDANGRMPEACLSLLPPLAESGL